jgi:phospholipase D1/2
VAGDEATSQAIGALRRRLLAEHLGQTVERVADRVECEGSLIGAVDALRDGGSTGSGTTSPRTLRALDAELPETVDALVPGEEILDPQHPLDADQVMGRFTSADHHGRARWRPWLLLAALLLAVGLAIAWRWTPLSDWLDVTSLVNEIKPFRQSPAAPAVVLGAFVLGSLVAVPVTLLILVTVLAFGPVLGFTYALGGAEAAAVATYWIGRGLGGGSWARRGGSRIARVSRMLPRRGILTITVIRLIPMAPFTVINVAAGAARIRLRDFAIGTLLGMAPGIGAAALLINRVAAVMHSPEPVTISLLVALIGSVAGATYFTYKWLARRSAAQRGAADD